MALRHSAVLVALLGLVACKHSDVAPVDAAAAPAKPTAAMSAPNGSPLSKIVPAARPGPRPTCPLALEPGVAFGPVQLGETVADLEAAGLTVKKTSDTHAEIDLGSGQTLKVTLCEGKIIDIFLDDLRTAPACVSYAGKPIANSIDREELEKSFGGCSDTPPRIGGTFERCFDGGVYVGHGLGTFLQLRVRPKSLPFDNACDIATDDGSEIALSTTEKDSLLKKTLNIPELGKYWHVNLPGRDPLRIVRTTLVPEQALMMFGSDVVWIDDADAKKGTAFFRVTSLKATKTKATLTFEYPIEGVHGTVTFAHTKGLPEWRLEKSEVSEK